MLTDLFEVSERILLALHDGGHTTKGCTLELLASVERVTELDETNVVLGDLLDEVLSGVELTKSKLVVVLIVENIEKRGDERVKVVHDGKLLEDSIELLGESVLCEHDLAHVERTNTCDLPSWVNDGRCLSLCLGENNIEEIAGGRDRSDGSLRVAIFANAGRSGYVYE